MVNFLIPDIGVGEKILRTAAVYFFLLAALRIAGKRQVSQMTTFDLVVLLLLSNVVQNAVIGNDNSLGGGLIGAAALLLINALVAWAAYRFKPVRRILSGGPVILVHDGHILRDRLDRERISLDQLQEAFRENGVSDPARVRYAILETDGKIHLLLRDNHPGTPPIK